MIPIAATTLCYSATKCVLRPCFRICRLAHRLARASTSAPATIRLFGTKPAPRPSVHDLSSIPADLKRLRCIEVDENGNISSPHVLAKKTELVVKYGLMPRDIRKIETSNVSHIRARSSTVILHLFHLKVLVQRDRILLFDDDVTSSVPRAAFLRDLFERIEQRNAAPAAEIQAIDEEAAGRPRGYDQQQQLTFEFCAIEAVLSSVVLELEGELEAVRLPAERILSSLEDDVDRRTLLALLRLSHRVARLAGQVEQVRSAVEDVLEWDHLDALCVTAKATSDGRSKAVDEDTLTAVELLLGSYSIAYTEIMHEVQNLLSDIRNTQESTSAILDANRNTLMLLDLQFRMGTIGLATGSMFSAFYGMNISNYIREYVWAFPAISGTSAIFGVAALCYGLLILRKFVRVRMERHWEAIGKTLK